MSDMFFMAATVLMLGAAAVLGVVFVVLAAMMAGAEHAEG